MTTQNASLYDMAELLLKRIKEQEPALADWTNASEAFKQISDAGVLMLGLKGFVAPHAGLLEETSRKVDRFEDWEKDWTGLTELLRHNLGQTGIAEMIKIDWEKFENQEEHREKRFVTISSLLRRLLLGVDWLPHWEF